MNQQIEVPPFIETSGDVILKKEIFGVYFDVNRVGNIKGSMPLMGVDFNETEIAYAKRLRIWRQNDHEVLFSGRTVKDMNQFQIAKNGNGDTIQFDFDSYTITTRGQEYVFPKHPTTVDEFITDCRRIGLKLFWKQEIIDKFGADQLSSKKSTSSYHNVLRQKF